MSMTNPQEYCPDTSCYGCGADLDDYFAPSGAISAPFDGCPDDDSNITEGWCPECAPDLEASAYRSLERKVQKNDGPTIRAMNHKGAILDVWGRLYYLFPGLKSKRGRIDRARRNGMLGRQINAFDQYEPLRNTYGPTNKREWQLLALACFTVSQDTTY